MTPLAPIHPIHYFIGSITHAPSAFEAWKNEALSYKAKFFSFYFFLILGIVAFSAPYQWGTIINVAAMYPICLAVLTIPVIITDPVKSSFTQRFSDAFFNVTLPFHVLIILNLIINEIVVALHKTDLIDFSMSLPGSVAINSMTIMLVSLTAAQSIHGRIGPNSVAAIALAAAAASYCLIYFVASKAIGI